MKPATAEWVEKAEGDWNAARQLNRVRKDPSYDAVCFHCQQIAEKYLKARLEEAGLAFARTHDLLGATSTSVASRTVLATSTALPDFPQSLRCRLSLSWTNRNQSRCQGGAQELVRRVIRTAFGLQV